MENIMNVEGTSRDCLTVVLPRTLSDLRSFLHGYRISNSGLMSRTTRASILISNIDRGIERNDLALRAARELAELDPSLSWLPGWKPRVAVAAKGER